MPGKSVHPIPADEVWDTTAVSQRSAELLAELLRWRRPRRVLVDITARLAPDNEDLAKLWAVMATGGEHLFQVLTADPEHLRKTLSSREFRNRVCEHYVPLITRAPCRIQYPPAWDQCWPAPHIWIGARVETQSDADGIAATLLRTPSAHHWVCVVPRSALDISSVLLPPPGTPKLEWVVCGGQSGKHAWPIHPEWIRTLRDQTNAAGVPFCFHQWGHWRWAREVQDLDYAQKHGDQYTFLRWEVVDPSGQIVEDNRPREGCAIMQRAGAGRAGREIDGRTWEQHPPIGDAP
ncbi:DUF5131 family protein [Mycobacteroides abscessus]|uniref:DUF5131 family protein n=1 Tax=Mycobacteroides abscessus TaxID=36809 RepID=UPI0009A5E38E|nr:DUF5131 family protein [Mycobacteroides abscessus]SLH38355.1 bacteriophage protein gp37 [Mycobacteroides abscessus subsp. massiliense]